MSNCRLKELEKLFSALKFRKFKHSHPKKGSDILIKDHEGNYAIAYHESRDKEIFIINLHPIGILVEWHYLIFTGQGYMLPNGSLKFKAYELHDIEEITFSDKNKNMG
jgi:hypothetical protein